MKSETAKKLIDKTRDDYNLIAHHFSSTRKFNWPVLKKLVSEFIPNRNIRVADLGCGNGRLYDLMGDKIDYFGLDLSDKLIEIAKKEHPGVNFTIGDILHTPYENNYFDVCISVATLHHIPGKQQRLDALKEIYRVTKPGGITIVTNWYFWDNPRYVKEIYTEAFHIISRKSDLDFGDFNMSWKSVHKNTITKRYFHAWTKREIRKEAKRAGFTDLQVIANYGAKDNGRKDPNLTLICKKPYKCERPRRAPHHRPAGKPA